MNGIAYAQTAEGGPGPLVSFLPLILVFAVFYFLLIRPQQQKAKEQRAIITNLRRNDEVITSGGIYGRIVDLNDKVVTLEIAPNTRIRVDRPRIDSVIKEGKGGGAGDQKGKEK
jgi:preprotein translocase subunit YajC